MACNVACARPLPFVRASPRLLRRLPVSTGRVERPDNDNRRRCLGAVHYHGPASSRTVQNPLFEIARALLAQLSAGHFDSRSTLNSVILLPVQRNSRPLLLWPASRRHKTHLYSPRCGFLKPRLLRRYHVARPKRGVFGLCVPGRWSRSAREAAKKPSRLIRPQVWRRSRSPSCRRDRQFAVPAVGRGSRRRPRHRLDCAGRWSSRRKITTMSGFRVASSLDGCTGRCAPGLKRPCFSGLSSTMNLIRFSSSKW